MKLTVSPVLGSALLALGSLVLGVRLVQSTVAVRASSLPKVVLSAESLTPRRSNSGPVKS